MAIVTHCAHGTLSYKNSSEPHTVSYVSSTIVTFEYENIHHKFSWKFEYKDRVVFSDTLPFPDVFSVLSTQFNNKDKYKHEEQNFLPMELGQAVIYIEPPRKTYFIVEFNAGVNDFNRCKFPTYAFTGFIEKVQQLLPAPGIHGPINIIDKSI